MKRHPTSDLGEFRRALRALYMQDPCIALPNALWKTEKRLSHLECSLRSDHGRILDLKAWDQEGLHVFWNKARTVDEPFQQIMENSRFMIIHDDYFQEIDVNRYSMIKPFFRIKHDNRTIPAYSVPSGFYIEEAHPEKDASQISDLIARCYKDLKPSPDIVRGWTTHHVFDRSLWIWIMDKHRGTPAALGIAELDRTVPEGSLEWIQVLPKYQGSGLGRVLVLELLNRLRGRAAFTTVSGEVDNETKPERLYRNCGFSGNDVWWLLQK